MHSDDRSPGGLVTDWPLAELTSHSLPVATTISMVRGGRDDGRDVSSCGIFLLLSLLLRSRGRGRVPARQPRQYVGGVYDGSRPAPHRPWGQTSSTGPRWVSRHIIQYGVANSWNSRLQEEKDPDQTTTVPSTRVLLSKRRPSFNCLSFPFVSLLVQYTTRLRSLGFPMCWILEHSNDDRIGIGVRIWLQEYIWVGLHHRQHCIFRARLVTSHVFTWYYLYIRHTCINCTLCYILFTFNTYSNYILTQMHIFTYM